MPDCNEDDVDPLTKSTNTEASFTNLIDLLSLFFVLFPMVKQSGITKYASKQRPAPKTSCREMSLVEKGIIIAFVYYL